MRQITDGHNVGDQVFVGSVTGAVNTTKLREWIMQHGRPAIDSAFTRQNAGEMLAAHEFDRSIHPRTTYLLDNPDALKQPLIIASWGKGAYVIDGWHRLLLIYMGTDRDYVPFMAYHVTKAELQRFKLPSGAVVGDVEYPNASH